MEHRGSLIRMFSSDEWKNIRFASKREENSIEDVDLDNEFWNSIVIIYLKGSFLMMLVLRIVDSIEKLTMGQSMRKWIGLKKRCKKS